MRRNVFWLRKRPERFLTLSKSHLRLYSIEDVVPTPIVTLPVHFDLDSGKDKLKCCDVCTSVDDFLALGYVSGRIIVTKTGVDEDIRTYQNVTDLTSDTSTSPVYLEFNPLSQYHLVACLEGPVFESGLACVYETNRPKVHSLIVNADEHLSCASWFQDDWCVFAAGGSKSVKFFDIREGSKTVLSASVDGPVSALRTDYEKKTQFAAIIGDTMQIYDRRGLDHPVYKLRLSNPFGSTSEDVVLKWNFRRPFFMTYFWRGTDTFSEIFYSAGEQGLKSERSHHLDTQFSEAPLIKMFATQASLESSIASGQEGRLFLEERCSSEMTDRPELHFEFYRKSNELQRISDLAYHPEFPSLMLLCGPEEKDDCSDISIIKVKNFVTGDFSCSGNLAFASDNELCLYNLGKVCDDDISNVMRLQALANYGTPLAQTIEGYVDACKAVADKSAFTSSDVKWVWRWLSKMINTESWKSESYGCCFPGVIRMMRPSYIMDSSSFGALPHKIQDVYYGRVRIYKGGSRTQILRLCGWPSFDESDVRVREFLNSVEEKQNMSTRAIALAMFFVKVDWAKEHMRRLLLLCKGENDVRRFELERFVEAVRSYRGLPDSWAPVFQKIKDDIRDPYLKMVIGFLNGLCNNMTSETSIMQLDGISVEDRVGFACLYFNDKMFVESLNSALADSSLGSSLQGLFICGLSRDLKTFRLLRRFVDRTGDVQTATLLYIVGHCYEQNSTPNTPVSPSGSLAFSETRCISSHSFSEPRDAAYREALKDEEWLGLHIIEDYLDLLNTWGLWKRRARLNVFLHWYSVETAKTPDKDRGTSMAELSCQFCPCPIGATSISSPEVTVSMSSDVLITSRQSYDKNLSTGSASSEPREQACRQCGKPLPRCIICRRRMGTETIVECSQLKSLSFWFTWCQKCRHGGHMVHMLQWFRAHDECAASNCLCQCRLADADYITFEESCLPDCPSCKNEGLITIPPRL